MAVIIWASEQKLQATVPSGSSDGPKNGVYARATYAILL